MMKVIEMNAQQSLTAKIKGTENRHYWTLDGEPVQVSRKPFPGAKLMNAGVLAVTTHSDGAPGPTDYVTLRGTPVVYETWNLRIMHMFGFEGVYIK